VKPATLTTALILLLAGVSYAQRQMERLDRGVIAIHQGQGNLHTSAFTWAPG
jgi:hypothetical protein